MKLVRADLPALGAPMIPTDNDFWSSSLTIIRASTSSSGFSNAAQSSVFASLFARLSFSPSSSSSPSSSFPSSKIFRSALSRYAWFHDGSGGAVADAGGGGREKSRLSKTESSEAGEAEKGRGWRWRWRRRRRWWEGEAMALHHSRISEVAEVVLYSRERRWSWSWGRETKERSAYILSGECESREWG